MTNQGSDTHSHFESTLSRRSALRTTAAIGMIATGGVTSSAAQSSNGGLNWEYDTGAEIHASPTSVDGFVYVGNDDGSVYALNDSTAYELWKFEADDSVRSSPLVVDEIVFFGSNDTNLYALDAKSGEEQWTYETGGEVVSSPVVANETVYVGSRDGNIYAINAESGREEWTYETDGRVDSSPVVVDGTVFVGSHDNNLYALDAESGEEAWRFETGGIIQTPPTIHNEIVYISSEDTHVYALGIDSGDEQWSKALYRNGGLTAPTVAVQGYSRATLFVADKVRVHALNAVLGGPRWSTRYGGTDSVAPTVVGNTVVAGDEKLLAIEPRTGEVTWDSNVDMTSSPTGIENWLLLGGGDSLYSIGSGVQAPSDDSRVTLGALGHNGTYRHADQTLEIDTTPPEGKRTNRSESGDGNGNETIDKAGNETEVNNKNRSIEQNDLPETNETSQTNVQNPGFGFGTGLTAISGAGYVLKRHFGGDTDD